MKGTSKVMMGAALVIVVSLAIILGVVLVLLAELYCSLLCRRRRVRQVKLTTSATTAPATAQVELPTSPLSPSPLSSFYSQGVLDAPRNFLFPRVDQQQHLSSHGGEGDDHGEDGISDVDLEVQRGKLHQLLNIHSSTVEGEISTAVETRHQRPTRFNLKDDYSADQSSSPSPSYIDPPRDGTTGGRQPRSSLMRATSVLRAEKVVYISNPIYDNNNNNDHELLLEEESCRKLPEPWPASIHDQERPTWDVANKGGGGGDDLEEESETTATGTGMVVVVMTPPLSPMKELPAAPKAVVSVALRDARCLGTSGSESNSPNAASYYSSSSGSPRTSPSW